MAWSRNEMAQRAAQEPELSDKRACSGGTCRRARGHGSARPG